MPGGLLQGRAAIVSDKTVDALYGERVSDALANQGFKVSNHLVNPGENSKSFEVVGACVRTLRAMESTGKVLWWLWVAVWSVTLQDSLRPSTTAVFP